MGGTGSGRPYRAWRRAPDAFATRQVRCGRLLRRRLDGLHRIIGSTATGRRCKGSAPPAGVGRATLSCPRPACLLAVVGFRFVASPHSTLLGCLGRTRRPWSVSPLALSSSPSADYPAGARPDIPTSPHSRPHLHPRLSRPDDPSEPSSPAALPCVDLDTRRPRHCFLAYLPPLHLLPRAPNGRLSTAPAPLLPARLVPSPLLHLRRAQHGFRLSYVPTFTLRLVRRNLCCALSSRAAAATSHYAPPPARALHFFPLPLITPNAVSRPALAS